MRWAGGGREVRGDISHLREKSKVCPRFLTLGTTWLTSAPAASLTYTVV